MKFSRASWIVTVTLSGMLASSAFAQAEKKEDKPAPQPPAVGTKVSPRADRLASMTESLKLTDAQREKIKPILEDETKQIKALREDQSVAKENRMTKYREIRKATHDKIRPILNPEQAKQWDSNRGVIGARPPAPAPAPAPAPGAAPAKK